MYKQIINQIANTLFINYQYIESPGLVNGQMGLALFFYHYSRYNELPRYADLADDLLDSVNDKIRSHYSYDFSNGISGIGWGLNYLRKKQFIELETNALNDIDHELRKIQMEDLIKDLDGDNPVFSKGLYFADKEEQTDLIHTMKQLSVFLETFQASISIHYLNSVFYFVLKTADSTITKIYNSSLLETTYSCIQNTLTDGFPIYTDLMVLNHLVSQMGILTNDNRWFDIQGTIQTLLTREEKKMPYTYCQYIIYQDIISSYNIPEYPILDQIIHNKVINLNIKDISLSGLAGLGILLIQGNKM